MVIDCESINSQSIREAGASGLGVKCYPELGVQDCWQTITTVQILALLTSADAWANYLSFMCLSFLLLTWNNNNNSNYSIGLV